MMMSMKTMKTNKTLVSCCLMKDARGLVEPDLVKVGRMARSEMTIDNE